MSESAFLATLGFDPQRISPDEALEEIHRRIVKEPELGRHLLPSLLPLAQIDNNNTRHWFLRCAYSIVTTWRGPSYELVALGEATRIQLQATSTAVVAQAIRLASALTPVAFRLCCFGEGDPTLWNTVEQLKVAIDLAAASSYDRICISVVKYFGMLICLFSPGSSSEISLDACNPNHPFLSRTMLEQESRSRLDRLVQWIPSTSANGVASIISVLAMICLARPQYIPNIVSTLLGYYVSPSPAWSATRVRYYKKNLKVMLMSIFKCVTISETVVISDSYMENSGDVVAALKLLGLEQEMVHHQHRRARLLQKNAAAQAAQIEESNRTTTQDRPFDITTIPSEIAAQLATDCLHKVSSIEFRQATASAPLRKLSIVGISDVMPPCKKIRVSTRDPRHRDARFTDLIQTVVEPAPVNEEPAVIMNTIDETKSIAELREALIKKEARERERDNSGRMATSTPTTASSLDTSTTSALNDDHLVMPTNLQGPETLSDEELLELRGECYDRLLQDGNTSSIGLSVWMQILVRLAARSLHEPNHYRERLWSFIRQNFEEQQELCISWLYEAWHQCSKDDYTSYAEQLFELARDYFVNQDQSSLGGFVQSFPYVPDSLLERLNELLDMETSRLMGIDALSILAVQRPPVREHAFNLLLARCIDQDADTRSATIKKVVTLVPQVTLLDTMAHQFAREHLDSIVHPETIQVKEEESMHVDEESQHKTEDVEMANASVNPSTSTLELGVVQSIALYFAMCAEEHSLLAGLFDVYIQCAASVQRIIRQQLYPLIKSIGMHSEYLLQLLQDFPKGGETLALRILIILTDKVAPSPRLVQTVKKVYKERELDARFLIPIVSGLDKMEIIETLPKIIGLLNKTEHERKIVREVLLRILTSPSTNAAASSSTNPSAMLATTPTGLKGRLGPAELLVALHTFDEQQVGIYKVAEATQICFGEKSIFTAEVLAVVLQQLLDRPVLPTLFMRTVIQSVTIYPSLSNYVITLLQKLITRHVWTNEMLWKGFIKCCKLMVPKSFDVMFQLPKPHLLNLLSKEPSLKPLLREYAQQKREQRGLRTGSTTTATTTTTNNANTTNMNVSQHDTEETLVKSSVESMDKEEHHSTASVHDDEEEQKENIEHS
ncbi:Symplekin tight junction protein C terminal-domain-containing protein [Syncephalis plumigaleata]|nr:Symplekin tight junction protein C terminal-domain-containing protein [Syncephalis plumigaleata]